MRKQAGFTLVEIAVVLVIIGLLLGGVLKGQELITQAKIKNVVNDFTGLAAAFYAYQDRYRTLPGDDSGATTRWGLVAGTSGNGNGLIAGGYSSDTANDESRLFWLHLRNAGFIGGDTTSQDQVLNTTGGKVGVQNGALGLTGPIICSANLPAKIAIGVDNQLDDGNGTKGSVRALKQSSGSSNDAVGPTATPDAYAESGGDLYVVCKSI